MGTAWVPLLAGWVLVSCWWGLKFIVRYLVCFVFTYALF